jgi:acyl-CoA thioesterase I
VPSRVGCSVPVIVITSICPRAALVGWPRAYEGNRSGAQPMRSATILVLSPVTGPPGPRGAGLGRWADGTATGANLGPRADRKHQLHEGSAAVERPIQPPQCVTVWQVKARSGRSPVGILKAVAVICLAMVTGCRVWLVFMRSNAKIPSAEPFTSTQVTPEERPVAVFIGDSYTVPGTWPGMVAQAQGWEMVNLGRGGIGYVASSTGTAAREDCGQDKCSFVEMAHIAIEREPDIVVVAGGRNDGGLDIDQQVRELFRTLRAGLPNARIIAVQPMWDASPYPDFLVRYGKVIRRQVEAVDGEYVKIGSPLADHPELVQDDRVHPTNEGQRVLGRAVNKALGRP